ncbi:hypothetical protein CARUB_v10015457mg [Capsella rubella]|uniref:VQ domain-containing protein n=1 Tax=Capsella rubella TaxID=81985 RepID=R0I2P9_9BRAS|nr:VQ motif-containing protein 19 [Capsella rubella]EOA32195.1 hypothetical protein CARUB_v10015457mg [Capsella rubella]
MEISTNPPSSSSSSASSSLHHHIITRSDHYPTTFVQADTSSFKQVVQMLTGSSSPRSPDSPRPPTTPSGKGNFVIPPIKTAQPKKHSGNKLYERRSHGGFNNNLIKNSLMIGGGAGSPRFSPRNQEILSPSCLDFPKLALNSPVTPLKQGNSGNDGDPFDRLSPLSEEERAIADKGYYLHQSPISTPRESEPQLLPLFPVTSPRVSPAE